HRGAVQPLLLSSSLSGSLKALSKRNSSTLYMMMVAALKTLLYRYSGQRDIAVGSTVAGRTRAELEGLIGFFVNTLVLRTELGGEASFEQLLAEEREVVLEAHTHQDLPFEKLVEELKPERSLSHTPLFQVMVTLDNTPTAKLQLPGIALQPASSEIEGTKFDLTLGLRQTADGLSGSVQYREELFEAVTIQRLVRHFERLLQEVVSNPKQRLNEIKLLSEAEQYQLIVGWNETEVAISEPFSLVRLIAEPADCRPDAVAVSFEGQQLSYGELDRRANQLGNYLVECGVGPETLVGLCVERSLEMVIGILGILKAGAAYVALDPGYPKERLRWMLEDAQISLMLTQQRIVAELPEQADQIISLDSDWEQIASSE